MANPLKVTEGLGNNIDNTQDYLGDNAGDIEDILGDPIDFLGDNIGDTKDYIMIDKSFHVFSKIKIPKSLGDNLGDHIVDTEDNLGDFLLTLLVILGE